MHPALWKLTQEILAQRDKRVQPKLLRSTLGPDAQVNGAIHLAIDTASSRMLST
jgi:glucokinase